MRRVVSGVYAVTRCVGVLREMACAEPLQAYNSAGDCAGRFEERLCKIRDSNNPRGTIKLYQVMEQIQRLEKEWDAIEALKKRLCFGLM